jgi:uncharacterized membrane protein
LALLVHKALEVHPACPVARFRETVALPLPGSSARRQKRDGTMPSPKAAKTPPAKSPEGKPPVRHRMVRHRSFYLALPFGVAALALSLLVWPQFAVGVGANVMFAVYLALIFTRTMPILTPEFLRKHADASDTPVGFIFLAVVVVLVVSFYALFSALHASDGPDVAEVGLSIVSVLLGWFVIHTMAALHYAYEFYESGEATPGKSSPGVAGGLAFPEGDSPNGIAFLYFSYVLGTAFAVSDIQVTSNHMRRLVMIHSVFSYFFNTLIVAATVNVAVAVGGH